MYKLLIAILLAAILITANAGQTDMRPGLWEITTTSDLLLLAPYIPPEQMQNVQDLAKDYGIEIPRIENGAAISKACITQQMAEQKTMPQFYQPELGCASTHAIRNGSYYKVEFACNSAELKGNGVAEGNLSSAQSFSGLTRFSGIAQGSQVNENAQVSGKWLTTNCGDVKPL